MKEPNLLRVGIVGAGGIARNHHIPSYNRCQNVRVIAACDISDSALAQVREQHGIERLYHDYDEMLASEQLDLLSVCTSNDMHYPVVMSAIEHGVDVYCEKPLALTLAEAQEMYQAARDKKTKAGVNFSHRRTPASRLSREIIASGALGKIHYVSAIYAAGRDGYASGKGTWRNDAALAGFGGLGDMGSHMIDMMRWWLAEDAVAVSAQMATYVHERVAHDTGQPMRVTTEDQGMLLLQYAGGAMGYLCGGYMFTGRGYDQRAEVYGSEGGLMYSQHQPHELQVHLPPDHLQRYTVLRQGGTRDAPYTTIAVPDRLAGHLPGESGVRRTVLMDFVDAYRAPGQFAFSPGLLEGVKVQEVLEATKRACSTRCWVSLPL